jgi:hypothetical protein
MIEENIKIHNNFTVEIKLGFVAEKSKEINDFAVNTWIFLPESLDINPNTYDKKDFYRDIKSTLRLITPVYRLAEIHSSPQSPLAKLQTVISHLEQNPTIIAVQEYEHHIKMFLSILKSSLRDESLHLIRFLAPENASMLIEEFTSNLMLISRKFRDLKRVLLSKNMTREMLNYYAFGDEYMSNIIEQHCFKIIKHVSDNHVILQDAVKIKSLISDEIQYKTANGFQVVDSLSPDRNRSMVHRLIFLKKYAENVLLVASHKKKDGILKEQVYYSLAAGLAMVFATAVAFSFQLKYGNLTMPFFVALVVSYILKDRIKEFSRQYFAHKLGRKYFDHKTRISLNNQTIGWSKEAMDFVDESKIPEEVIKIRNRSAILEADNRNNNEKIILFRKLFIINRNSLEKCSDYPLQGINDILKLNVNHFTLKMDNPEIPLFVEDKSKGFDIVLAEKIYYLNLLMQLKSEGIVRYRRFRIVFNRYGIKEIETLAL